MKISEIYRMDVYSDSGQYLGDVQDIVIDLEKGEISRILMTPWKSVKSDAAGLLKKKSILYKSVKNVGDVVLVSVKAYISQPSCRKKVLQDVTCLGPCRCIIRPVACFWVFGS